MKKLLLLSAIFLLIQCSGGVDTTKFSPSQHFEYAKNLFNEEDYEIAIKEFQSILLQYPGNAITDDTQYLLGMCYFNRGEYLLAAYEFGKLIRDIPASEYLSDSQFNLAKSYFLLSPNFQLDQEYTLKAIDQFQAFIDFFPSSPKVQEAEESIKVLNDKLAKKEFNNAFIYERMDYKNAAIKYYEKIVDTYHDTDYAPIALYNKIKLEIEMKKVSDARNDISKFLSRYPDNDKSNELQNLLKEL